MGDEDDCPAGWNGMNEQRRGELEALLSADLRQAGAPSPRIGSICQRLVTELGVAGAGATVLSRLEADGDGTDPGPDTNRALVHATDQISAGLEELQLTVGEGPCLEAFESGGPVLVADLAAEATSGRWPAFATAAAELGAAAVFSFPLQIGVIRLGSLDCYNTTPGELTGPAITDGLLLADLATQAVLAELDGHTTDDLSWLADVHTQVHQATGMVSVQLGASTQTALLRLRAHAFAHEQTVAAIAALVVSRQLRFSPESSEG